MSLSSIVVQGLPALKGIQLGENGRFGFDDGTWPGKLHLDHNLTIVPSSLRAMWTPSHNLSSASGSALEEVLPRLKTLRVSSKVEPCQPGLPGFSHPVVCALPIWIGTWERWSGQPCWGSLLCACEDGVGRPLQKQQRALRCLERRVWEHEMVLQEQRSKGRETVRTEKGIAENQSSFSGHSTPRMRQCLDLGTVCVRAGVEHVRDWNVLRTVEAKQLSVVKVLLCACAQVA